MEQTAFYHKATHACKDVFSRCFSDKYWSIFYSVCLWCLMLCLEATEPFICYVSAYYISEYYFTQCNDSGAVEPNNLQDIKKRTVNNRVCAFFCFIFFLFLEIDTNTQDTDTKTLTAVYWPSGPALNCTSFGRRNTNKYVHATITNNYQMECTKKHQRAACGNRNL